MAAGPVHDLIARLEREGIAVLHWKSNEHLEAALTGETDLDLLVEDVDDARIERILSELGFIRMRLQDSVMFPGRSGYVGLDDTTGVQYHLDVHTRLVLGEQLVKNHHLPVEEWLFAGARRLHGMPVPDAAKEFAILYLRTLFKTTTRQRLRSALTGRSALPGSIQQELDWLGVQVTEDELHAVVTSSGLDISGDELAEFHRAALAHAVDWRYLGRQKRSIKRRLRRYQRQSAVVAKGKQWVRRLRASRPFRRLGLGVKPKTLVGRGAVIAVVGADGSGKTRLTRDLQAWISWKLRVRHVYYGQPKSGIVFKGLNKPGSMLRRREATGKPGGAILSRVTRSTEAAKWVVLAWRRRRLAQLAKRNAAAGIVVIAERYPLREFHQMVAPMDGPRLQGGRPTRRMARFELRHYTAIPEPDLVIVLKTRLETLRERKLDLTVEEHQAKVDAIQTLRPGPGRVVIDAGQPYEEVLLEAKVAVWEALRASP